MFVLSQALISHGGYATYDINVFVPPLQVLSAYHANERLADREVLVAIALSGAPRPVL